MVTRKDQGFTYIGVLFFVALTATGMAALGQMWSTAAQRERERELEFRGREIAKAIASFMQASPTQPQQYPRSFDDLLSDNRSPFPRHHLRRLYADPFTGQADWEFVPEPGTSGTFSGVRSRSEQALLRDRGCNGVLVRQAKDWVFTAGRGAVADCSR